MIIESEEEEILDKSSDSHENIRELREKKLELQKKLAEQEQKNANVQVCI